VINGGWHDARRSHQGLGNTGEMRLRPVQPGGTPPRAARGRRALSSASWKKPAGALTGS
jgi:hypothetical protein